MDDLGIAMKHLDRIKALGLGAPGEVVVVANIHAARAWAWPDDGGVAEPGRGERLVARAEDVCPANVHKHSRATRRVKPAADADALAAAALTQPAAALAAAALTPGPPPPSTPPPYDSLYGL